ncbi:MAG: hypothetical protein HY741_11940 [Chloroflexi bacterium]|nr:hypothetical protein [Chloroflexota bacterium]
MNSLLCYRPLFLASALLVAGLFLFVSSGDNARPAFAAPNAATFTVTTTSQFGTGSLGDAIAAAAAGDVIDFNLSGCPCTIALVQELAIQTDLTIQGPGADQLTLDGQNSIRVLSVLTGTAALSSLTIANGAARGDGGGIYNTGALTLDDVAISNNVASASGGGIYNADGATLSGNRLLINGNQANAYFGGGIVNVGNGQVTLTNTTFSGNYAADDGGALYNNDNNLRGSTNSVTLLNVTIANNSTASDAGGIDNYGTINFKNTLIAGNTAPGFGPDCRNPFGHPYNSQGYNLVGNNTDCTFAAQTGDLVGASSTPIDARLNALADNGGPTQTHALMTDSPALDAGTDTGCPATDQRGVARPQGLACDIGAYEFQPATPPSAFNSAWTLAQRVNPNPSVTVTEFLNQPDESRWYKFAISPRSKVTITLTNLPADYNLVVFKDILKAYEQDRDALNNPNPDEELERLGAEFAPEAFSPEAFSPEAFSPEAFSPEAFSPEAFSPEAFSPEAFSPEAFSPEAFSPEAFSPEAFSPEAFSPEAFSPEAFSPEAFSPEAFSPEAFSPEAFSSAQMRSIIGVSAFPGAAGEGISINTWDNTGDFYVRVRGANGAHDPNKPFTLTITVEASDCASVFELTTPTSLTPISTSKATLILVDWNRMPGTAADKSALHAKLDALAAATDGVVVDVSQDARVSQGNTQADAHRTCPVAKNLVARAIKDIIDLYDANGALQYIVLVGGDDVIPFFRYPDQALLAAESGYIPPVRDNTASQASLRLNYILTQDPYAARTEISRGNQTFVIPSIAVGRLVETPDEIGGIVDAYLALNNGVAPLTTNALVTGYDFLADAAGQVKGELESGMGATADALIAPRDAAPTDPVSWNADALRAQMLNQRHDIIFLAGHFSQGSALAADWTTHVRASEIAASSVNLENVILFSAGCHSGYNLIDADAVSGVTAEPDWAQAFAMKRATFIGGTGYQYGDTDVIEYTERLLYEFARQLRTGSGPVSVGNALLRAKQEYLANTPQLRGIHEKTLLQSTLFGLPMLRVNMPGQRINTNRRSKPELAITLNAYTTNPGSTLALKYANVSLSPALQQKSVTYKQLTDNSNVIATYLQGREGIVSNPTEPLLPLQIENVSAAGIVLRGVGLRGGAYTDLDDILPATGAPATEIRGVHVPFPSQVFFPIRVWSVNYFDALAQNGATRLMLTPAQYRAHTADPARGTWRKYSQLALRLFYSGNTTIYNDARNIESIPSLAAAPSISNISATSVANQVHFRANVVGNPAAGIQEVWVTYTGAEGDLYGAWQSLDLVQSNTDSTLWEGDLTLGATAPKDLRFIVQAVNGVGLVTLAANLGNYYAPFVSDDPGLPRAPSTTALEFQSPPASGKYNDAATFTAILTSEEQPVAGKFITFGLGAQRRRAMTDANGQATARLSLLTLPGAYAVSVAFAGDASYDPASATTTFNVTKQNTQLTLVTPATQTQYSDAANLFASVRDEKVRALGQVTIAFVAANASDTQATTAITNFASEAHVTNIPFQAGTYELNASFGNTITLDGNVIDLTDPRYNASSAKGALDVAAENATVTYTGETVVPANGDLVLGATVTQEDDGQPGDLTLARVRYQLYDENAQLVDSKTDDADANGNSTATLSNVPGGNYILKVTVVGGFFTSATVEIPVVSQSVALSQSIRLKSDSGAALQALKAKFKLDGRETGFKLVDTAPGSFQYIETLNNTGNVALTVTVNLTLPASIRLHPPCRSPVRTKRRARA